MSVKPLFDNIRADDFVEYYLFPNLELNNGIKKDEEFLAKYLQEINKSVKEFTKDYIWHKEPFQLFVHNSNINILSKDDENKERG